MAVIEPNSEIYLIKCPLELDNLNQLSFANATAQHNYFNGLPKLSLTNATFQRKDGTIRWPGSMESLLEYNYCMYRNKSHGNKWFYAFIDNIRYVNDNMSAIKISTDAWQTYGFDLTWHASYVEREHVNDDTIGLHTIPEGLDTGEYVCNDVQDVYYAKKQYWSGSDPSFAGRAMLCAQVTTLILTKDGVTTQPDNIPERSVINGVPQGTYIVAIPYNKDAMAGIYGLTGAYAGAGRSDAIVSMFICPMAVVDSWIPYTGNGIWASGYYYRPNETDSAYVSSRTNINMPATLNGYTPKNNKCYVGPYNYFHITNNCGTDIEYNYEDFYGMPYFTMNASIEQGAAIIFKPSNSKRSFYQEGVVVHGNGYSEGVMGAKLPLLSWQNDFYLNWVAQNGKNIAIQTGLAAVGFATNAIGGTVGPAAINAEMRDSAVERGFFPDEEASPSVNAGGLLGGVINFASQVANTQNAIRNAKMVPPQAKGNVSGGYLQFATDNCKFTIYKMSCRAEYIKCIDDYFSMFGYKVNSLKIPNITGRQNWNYVKTLGCNITGDVPQDELQKIKAMFDHGVTLWHNTSTFLDYSQNNNIV